jgi:hypothetical protein
VFRHNLCGIFDDGVVTRNFDHSLPSTSNFKWHCFFKWHRKKSHKITTPHYATTHCILLRLTDNFKNSAIWCHLNSAVDSDFKLQVRIAPVPVTGRLGAKRCRFPNPWNWMFHIMPSPRSAPALPSGKFTISNFQLAIFNS